MKQIIHFDRQLKEDIENIESLCNTICMTVATEYQPLFFERGQHLILELVRKQKGNKQADKDYFNDDYESFIEIGIEQDDDYFPNGYIPIWKCKEEWFQKTGYLTSKNELELERILRAMVIEMLEE
ncbi:hypothetical protein A8F94_02800 [Bacillus sp. FJAT-27225]|uniref:hypothetical protein n=1 Tax=Bacillus sp. FJAT-27225 TaxID=1743144 RepID=UPI00080C2781|nr:hypothetical protein [Bacillus sp. FJAT-27225]OCA91529.1 hypothetical protein A8F94_02800 [Bacillus sp. FJAT-27225]